MLGSNLASSRWVRVGIFGFVAITAAAVTSESAQARRHHRHHTARHVQHDDGDSYNPKFSSIIVDGNSGATLESNNPDGLRHPASLTKMMTLYLLFERLKSGKMTLDTEMPVSEHASDQDPTKLGLRPGSTLRVEDAIKGIVTRSANDAAVVIAEAVGGTESNFAAMMTRKAHALGMNHTLYRNASGLPNDEQVTTARDESILGRALQDRFPRYYRFFSTTAFTFRGHVIRGHNHLLGSVDGVDGIKTGYIRASGFNLVTSMHRGNRFLIGVVMGGRSASSRDAIMRNLLAENLDKAATTRTVAAITEHNVSDAEVANAADEARPLRASEPRGSIEVASAAPDQPLPAAARTPTSRFSALAQATAAVPSPQSRPEPAPLTSGVIQTEPTALIPGSSEPMKPVRVKTVQVKAGPLRLATGNPGPAAPPVTSAIPSARGEMPETSNALIARAEMPPQPPGFGTGHGVLGVLPASSPTSSPAARAVAYAAPPAVAQPQTVPENSAVKPSAAHTGWIVQVGALDSENEAQQRIEAARHHAKGLLTKADPFTETVTTKGDKKLYRARFAGLDREQAEAVCRTLRRSDISCITMRTN
jgi:D-alanyl-D-alanine carboxypeptidase